MSKLTTKEIVNLLNEGAILRKTYGVYSYWSLYTSCGKTIYNFRKGSPEAAKSQIKYQIVEQDKSGFSIKLAAQ